MEKKKQNTTTTKKIPKKLHYTHTQKEPYKYVTAFFKTWEANAPGKAGKKMSSNFIYTQYLN